MTPIKQYDEFTLLEAARRGTTPQEVLANPAERPRRIRSTVTARPPGIKPGDTAPPKTKIKKAINIPGVTPFQPEKPPVVLETKGLSKQGKKIIQRINRQAQRDQAIIGGTATVTKSRRGTFAEIQAGQEMRRIGKGMVPFWLTVEDWDRMSPLERGASLAGDIGTVILLGLASGAGRAPKASKVNVPQGAKFKPVDINKLPYDPYGVPGRPGPPSYGYAYEYNVPVVDPMPGGMPPRLPRAVPTGKVIVVPGPTIEVPSGISLLSRGSRIAVKTVTKTPTKLTVPIKKIVDQAVKINDDLLTKPTRRSAAGSKGMTAKEFAEIQAAARRMTPKQFERYYGASELIIAIGMPTDFIAVEIKPTGKTAPKTPTEIDTDSTVYTRTRTLIINRDKKQPKSGQRTYATQTTKRGAGAQAFITPATGKQTAVETGARTQAKEKQAVATETAIKTTARPAVETKETPAEAAASEAATQAKRTATKPGPVRLPKGNGKDKDGELTEEQIRSAIAWKVGFVIHALISPYRREKDEYTWHVDKAPAGLRIINAKGKGSQQRSIKLRGRLTRTVTVDVGNQDVIITPSKRGRVATIRHRRDTTGTTSNLTISRKRGRMFRTNMAGGTITSRRPIKAVRNV